MDSRVLWPPTHQLLTQCDRTGKILFRPQLFYQEVLSTQMVLRPPTRAIRSSCYAGRTEPALPNWPWGRLQELRTVGSWGEGVLHGITHCILRAHRFGIRSLAAQVPSDSSYAKSCAKCVLGCPTWSAAATTWSRAATTWSRAEATWSRATVT